MLRRLAGRESGGAWIRSMIIRREKKDSADSRATAADAAGLAECLRPVATSLLRGEVAKKKRVRVYRWNPEEPRSKPRMQEFLVDVEEERGTMVLDVLTRIKARDDPSLAFRRSCREGICGSCAVNVNGSNVLACVTKVDPNPRKTLVVYPLPHAYVVRDLVADTSLFLEQYRTIVPSLERPDDGKLTGSRQLLQSPRDRRKLDGLYECILCGCCSFACPSYWWLSDKYLGPAVLMQAYRWIIDSRDQANERRLSELRDFYSVFRCHAIFNCTEACPKGLNPGKAIALLKATMAGLASKEKPDFDNSSANPCGDPA